MTPARSLLDGRCCGQRPMAYKRQDYLVCINCCAAYGADGKQFANWAWKLVAGGFEPTEHGARYARKVPA